MPGESRKVNLNEASLDEISKIPGINYEKAQYIVNQRPFRSWDDLKKVQGFTDTHIKILMENCTI